MKALIAAGHFDVGLVVLVNERAQVRFDGDLFAHGAAAANGRLVFEGGHDGVAVTAAQPILVFLGLTESRRVRVFAKQVQQNCHDDGVK